MPSHLFVYGSLMGSIQSKIARLLHENSDFLGVAKVQGRLYDLGSYPGLIIDENAALVEGHIFKLHHPAALLDYLDQYEGILPNNPDLNEYVRQLIPVDLSGEMLQCWAYIYQLSIQNLPIISFPNYLDYLKEQPEHRKFLDEV